MVQHKVVVLHSALLARKGEARPSLFGSSSPLAVEGVRDGRPTVTLDSGIGGAPANTPDELVEAKEARGDRRAAPVAAISAAIAPGKGGRKGRRVSLSLRLDAERHRRLRIFSACTRRSMQDVLTAALDGYLAREAFATDHGCACLRTAAPPQETSRDETT